VALGVLLLLLRDLLLHQVQVLLLLQVQDVLLPLTHRLLRRGHRRRR
jgi:hypothetical protein